jgi:hypothetical protein
MRPARLALLAWIALFPGIAAPEAKAPSLVTYELEESLRSITPAGERVVAIGGRVSLTEDKVRLDLVGARFPRSRAKVLVVDGDKLLLVDPKERDLATLPASELESLWVTPAGKEVSGAGVRLRDSTVSVERDGQGKPFQGHPTLRYRVTLNVWHSVTMPGRVTSIHEVVRGVVETAPELSEARSKLDDLLRLFRARGAVRETLEDKLAAVEGFPVLVTLDGEVETSAEPLAGGAADKPQRTTTHVSRQVQRLTVRPWKPADAALFREPEQFRRRGPERMLDAQTSLP